MVEQVAVFGFELLGIASAFGAARYTVCYNAVNVLARAMGAACRGGIAADFSDLGTHRN